MSKRQLTHENEQQQLSRSPQYNVIKIKTIRNRISLQIIKVSKIMKENGKDIIKWDQIFNVFFQNGLKDIKKIIWPMNKQNIHR